MSPSVGADYAFDTSENNTIVASWESHMVERFVTMTRGCTCVVRAEARAPSGMLFSLDDYTLVVETDLLKSDESFGP
jgi:hypothetical protein